MRPRTTSIKGGFPTSSQALVPPLHKALTKFDPKVHLEAPSGGIGVPTAFIYHASTGPIEPLAVNADGYLRYVERFPIGVLDNPIAGRNVTIDAPVDLPNPTFSSYSSAKFLGWAQHRIIRARMGLVPLGTTTLYTGVAMALVLAEDSVPQATTLYDVASVKGGTVGPMWAPNWTDWIQAAPNQGMGKMVSGSWFDNASYAGVANDGTALPATRQLRYIVSLNPSASSTYIPASAMLFMEAEFWVRQSTAGPLVGIGVHSTGANANLNTSSAGSDGYLNLDQRDAQGGPWGFPAEDTSVVLAPTDATASRSGSGTYSVNSSTEFESNRFDSLTANTGYDAEVKTPPSASVSIEAQAYDWLAPFQKQRVHLDPVQFQVRHGDICLDCVDVGDVDGIIVFLAEEEAPPPVPPEAVWVGRHQSEIDRESAYQKMLNHLHYRRGLRPNAQGLGANDPVNPNAVGDWIMKAWSVAKKAASASVAVAKSLVHSSTVTNAAATVAKAAFTAYAPAASALWYTVQKADAARTVLHAAATLVAKKPGDTSAHATVIPVLQPRASKVDLPALERFPEIAAALAANKEDFQQIPLLPPIPSVPPSQKLIAALQGTRRA